VAENDVNLSIGVETKDAIKSIQDFQKQTNQQLQSIQNSFATLGGGVKSFATEIAGALAGLFTLNKIKGFLEDGIAAAAETEKATKSLGFQMQLTGEYTDEALKSFSDFADELEKTTNISDDVILQQASLAKAFGLTNDETKSLLTAASELSAVTGDSLPSSVDTLIQSYNGQVKALKKVLPDVQSLTKEQLKQGDAIELVKNRLGGSAANALNTFEGATKSADTAFGNFGKEIGKVVIGNRELIGTLKLTADKFNEFSESVKRNQTFISKFISGIVEGFFDIGSGALEAFAVVDRAISAFIIIPLTQLGTAVNTAVIKVNELTGAFPELAEKSRKANKELEQTAKLAVDSAVNNKNAFHDFSDELQKTKVQIKEYARTFVDQNNKIDSSNKNRRPIFTAEELEKAKNDYKRFSQSIIEQAGTETDKARAQQQEQLDTLKDYREKKLITQEEYSKRLLDINTIYAKKVTEAEKKEAEERKKVQDEYLKHLEELYKNPIKIFFEGSFKDIPESDFAAAGSGLAASFFTALKKGKDGPQEFAQSIVNGVGDALKATGNPIAAGIGEILGPLFSFSSQDPEAVKAQTQAFVDASPVILENLAKFAPAFLEALSKALSNPDLYVEIVKSIGRALAAQRDYFTKGATADFFPKLLSGFKTAMSKISKSFAGDFARSFRDSANEFAKTIYDSALDIGPSIKKGFEDGINSVADTIEQIGINIKAALADPAEWGRQIAVGFKDGLASVSQFILGLNQSLIATGQSLFAQSKETFIASIDYLKAKFNESIDYFGQRIDAFTSGISEAFSNFAAGISDIFGPVFDRIGQLFSDLSAGIASAFDPIISAVNSLIESVKSVTGASLTSGGSNVSSAKKKASKYLPPRPKFAEGGIVPPGFPNDSYPAFLTSGEKVIPQGKELPGNDMTNALLGKILTALQQQQTVETSVKFNERVLADIILQLTRNNARLAG
jgi:hypothetical protein